MLVYQRVHQITSPWKKCGAVEPQDTTEVAVEISISRLQVFHFAPGVAQRKKRLFPKMGMGQN